MMTVEQIIEKQMRAYDDRDIDNMMTVFSEDIKILNFSDGTIIVDGIDNCQKMYVELFKRSPNLRAEIINTIAFNNIVIVQEYIHGRNGSNEKYSRSLFSK